MKMDHLANKTGIYSIRDLQRHYEKLNRGHWFSPDVLKFFKSKLSESLIYTDNKILFFSSEQGPNGVRMYSIREYDPENGNIDTIGLGFQGYKTLAAAKRAAQTIVKRG